MPVADLGSEGVYYTMNHPGKAPVLLLIHGSGGSHRHWPEAIRRLGDVCVCAVDLPGHGRSTGSSRNTVGAYADVIERFVSHTGLKRIALAGHSLGGAIVQLLALRSPQWLSRMILVGTGCRLRVLPEILDGLRVDFPGTVELITAACFGPSPESDLLDAVKKDFLHTPPQVFHDDFSACDAFDITAKVGEIITPALIVTGAEDRLTPVKYGQYLHRHLPDSQMTVIEGAGHMMALERPIAMAECIRAFVSND